MTDIVRSTDHDDANDLILIIELTWFVLSKENLECHFCDTSHKIVLGSRRYVKGQNRVTQLESIASMLIESALSLLMRLCRLRWKTYLSTFSSRQHKSEALSPKYLPPSANKKAATLLSQINFYKDDYRSYQNMSLLALRSVNCS